MATMVVTGPGNKICSVNLKIIRLLSPPYIKSLQRNLGTSGTEKKKTSMTSEPVVTPYTLKNSMANYVNICVK